MSNLLGEVMERIDELYKNPASVTGVATGFVDLDEMTSGLHPGELIIVAGRPSMGKAQPLDARVKTRAGWKAMGEVQVGDHVLTSYLPSCGFCKWCTIGRPRMCDLTTKPRVRRSATACSCSTRTPR